MAEVIIPDYKVVKGSIFASTGTIEDRSQKPTSEANTQTYKLS